MLLLQGALHRLIRLKWCLNNGFRRWWKQWLDLSKDRSLKAAFFNSKLTEEASPFPRSWFVSLAFIYRTSIKHLMRASCWIRCMLLRAQELFSREWWPDTLWVRPFFWEQTLNRWKQVQHGYLNLCFSN